MNLLPAALASVLLAACGTLPSEAGVGDPLIATNLSPTEFPGAAGLLEGFDTRRTGSRWNTGDRVLFGLRLKKGAAITRWLLQLEVIASDRGLGRAEHEGDPMVRLFQQKQWSYTAVIAGERQQIKIKSAMSLIEVKVHDEDGRVLGRSLVQMPSELMSRGLLPGIECALTHQANGNDFREFDTIDDVRPMAEGLIALIALLDVVQHDNVLEDYFWQVVQKPSIWSVITGLGIKASLTASLEKSARVERLPPHLPPTQAYAMPLRVEVNDSPALIADVIAITAERPYGLCGGIVAASARHPSQDDLRFDVQLLAARHGPRNERR